jgi:hypothetical protein
LPVEAQRIRPPDSIKCPRNDLTAFTGKVLYYKRLPGKIVLRMKTDENTKEHFTLNFQESESPAQWFLLYGEPFKQNDLSLIESSNSNLKPNMRATVWVCQDGSKPVIDWQPPRD